VVTGARVWAAIESPMIAAVMTDYWEPYKQFVPSEKHRQSKAETYTVEGYSKSETMLRYSVMLLMAQWNGELKYILN
jgi:insertion element IS1 protein InsB